MLLLRGVGGLPFRTVGGLPPPANFDGTAFLLLAVALLLLVAPAVVVTAPLFTGLGGSPPRLPLLLVVQVLTLDGLVGSASSVAAEVVATLLPFALMVSGCSGSFSVPVSFVVASGTSSNAPWTSSAPTAASSMFSLAETLSEGLLAIAASVGVAS